MIIYFPHCKNVVFASRKDDETIAFFEFRFQFFQLLGLFILRLPAIRALNLETEPEHDQIRSTLGFVLSLGLLGGLCALRILGIYSISIGIIDTFDARLRLVFSCDGGGWNLCVLFSA